MSLRDTIGDVFDWWQNVLGHSLPAFLKSQSAASQIELTIKRNGVVLTPVEGARIQFEPVLIDDVSRLKSFIDVARGGLNDRDATRNVRVRVSDGRFLIRPLASLQLPKSKRKSMAEIDMLGATPFAADEVHLVHNAQSPEETITSYAIVKKSILDPVFQQIKASGYRVIDLKFGEENEGFMCDEDSLRQILPNSRAASFQKNMLSFCAFLLVLGVALTIGRANWRHIEANDTLDAAIEIESKNASNVRRLIAQRNESLAKLTTARTEKDGAVPIVIVMEELSKIIPDDTWITDLDINSGVVSLSGFSADAAKLIPKLEASDLFLEPTFRSPVLRVNVQVGERFSIVMKTKRGEDVNG